MLCDVVVLQDRAWATDANAFMKDAESKVTAMLTDNQARFQAFRELQRKGVQWPHSPAVRNEVENAGFAFRPMMIKRDRCICETCQVEVSGWRPWHNPWIFHDFAKHHPSFLERARSHCAHHRIALMLLDEAKSRLISSGHANASANANASASLIAPHISPALPPSPAMPAATSATAAAATAAAAATSAPASSGALPATAPRLLPSHAQQQLLQQQQHHHYQQQSLQPQPQQRAHHGHAGPAVAAASAGAIALPAAAAAAGSGARPGLAQSPSPSHSRSPPQHAYPRQRQQQPLQQQQAHASSAASPS